MKIKPCPLCGRKVKLWVRKCALTKYTIGCTNELCFLWIPKDVELKQLHNYGTCYVSKKLLIESWNRRVI